VNIGPPCSSPKNPAPFIGKKIIYSASTGARKYRRPKRYSRFQAVLIKRPNRIPHSPAQKSGLYIPGGLKDIGAFTPKAMLSPNSKKRWLQRTTASPPITPAVKQIAVRCISVKPFRITFKPPLFILSRSPVGLVHFTYCFHSRFAWQCLPDFLAIGFS
jgi:hypothetical protein